MPNIGVPGLILILIIALIVFGPAKLPQLGRAIGETLKEFKSSTKDLMEDESVGSKEEQQNNKVDIRKEK